MRAAETFVLMSLQSFAHQHQAILMVSKSDLSIALRVGQHLSRTRLRCLPIAELSSVLDHLLLAGQAMTGILFIGFLELVERSLGHSPFQILQAFLVSVLGLLACWSFCLVLGLQRHHSESQQHYNCGIPHTRSPGRVRTRNYHDYAD